MVARAHSRRVSHTLTGSHARLEEGYRPFTGLSPSPPSARGTQQRLGAAAGVPSGAVVVMEEGSRRREWPRECRRVTRRHRLGGAGGGPHCPPEGRARVSGAVMRPFGGRAFSFSFPQRAHTRAALSPAPAAAISRTARVLHCIFPFLPLLPSTRRPQETIGFAAR